MRVRIVQATGMSEREFMEQEIRCRKFSIYNSVVKVSLFYGAETWRLTDK